MRRTGNIGLVAAALLAVASPLPEHASAQVPDAFDVRTSGFAPASPSYDTRSVLMTASTGWIAPRGMSASFVGCPRPSPYMFGSNPGLFRYGWYMSPFDVRFSRAWFRPVSPWYPWFTGFRSRPGSSSMCGPGSAGSAFFFGAGGFGYGGYPGYGGFGYGGYPGYGGFGYGGFGDSYGGYSGYRGFSGLSGDSSAYPGGSGFDSSEWGHIPESLRNMKGFRVIESRPTTVGADLRRSDPGRFDEWSRRFGNEAADARSAMPDARNAIGDALARTRASREASRESVSDAIARARTTSRTGSATPRPAPDRTRAAAPARTASPSRTAAPSSTRARTTPRSTARPSPSGAARSAPRSSPRPTGKGTRKRSPRSSGETSQ